MKRSRLKEIINEEYQKLLSEASTIGSLGASRDQVKKAHTQKYTPNFSAKSKFEKVGSKTDVKNILQSKEGKSYWSQEVVVGFDKDKNMFIAGSGDNKNWNTRKIAPDGKVLDNWDERTPLKALAHFQGIGDYHVSRTGSTKKGGQPYYEKLRSQISKYQSPIIDALRKTFEKEKVEGKKKIIDLIQNDEWTKAYRIMQSIQKIPTYSYEEMTEREWTDIINTRDFSERVQKALPDKEWDAEWTEDDIRKAALKVGTEDMKSLKKYFKV